jgi:hypothetical protein
MFSSFGDNRHLDNLSSSNFERLVASTTLTLLYVDREEVFNVFVWAVLFSADENIH